jgi:hypothetical protein
MEADGSDEIFIDVRVPFVIRFAFFDFCLCLIELHHFQEVARVLTLVEEFDQTLRPCGTHLVHFVLESL